MSSPEILSRLIRFETVSSDTNLPLLDWVADLLAQHGVASERLFDATGTKANLVATIGPRDRPGLVLSGHTDVVPVEGQPWTRDPWGGEVAGGRVWGRGASDMKGFIACVLAAVPAMTAQPLSQPLHLCFSYDEEVGCEGVMSAVAAIAGWGVPQHCLVGEPTGMQVVTAHKSKRAVRIEVTGRAAHSSLAPLAANALDAAARIAVAVGDLAEELSRGTSDPLYDVGQSTASAGVLLAGSAVNIVPGSAVLEVEVRTIAADDPDALIARIAAVAAAEEARLRRTAPEARIVLTGTIDYDGFDTPPDHPLVTRLKHLAGRNDHAKVAFGTEAGRFAAAGIPPAICGPGDIARAHKADEWIGLDELAACDAFLARLVETCR